MNRRPPGIFNVLCPALLLYPQLTTWQERLKVLRSWGLLNRQTRLRLLLYMNSEHLGEHHGPCPWSTIKKLEDACLAVVLTLITDVILSLTVSPDGRKQGDMATWLHLFFFAWKMAEYLLYAVTDCWRRRLLKLSTNTCNDSNLVCASSSTSVKHEALCVNYTCREVLVGVCSFAESLYNFTFLQLLNWLIWCISGRFPVVSGWKATSLVKEKLFEEITG